MADWTDIIQGNLDRSSPQTIAEIQRARAMTGYLGAETTGQDLSNQQSAMKQQLLQSALQRYQQRQNQPQQPQPMDPTANASGVAGGAAGPAGAGSGAVDFNPDHARAVAHSQYAPVANTYSNDELQDIQDLNTFEMAGIPTAGMRDNITKSHDLRVSSINDSRQKAAENAYAGMYSVASAPEGHALDVLKSLKDPKAQALAARYAASGATDDDIRQHAGQLAAVTYQEAGLPVSFKDDGYAYDKQGNKIPQFGTTIGLGPKELKELAVEANKPITIYDNLGNPTQMPTWKYAGAKSAGDYVTTKARMAQPGGPTAAGQGSAGAAAGTPPAMGVNGKPQLVTGADGKLTAPPSPNSPTGNLDMSNFTDSDFPLSMKNRTPSGVGPSELAWRANAKLATDNAAKMSSEAQSNLLIGNKVIKLLNSGAATGRGSEFMSNFKNWVGNWAPGNWESAPAQLNDELGKFLKQQGIVNQEYQLGQNGLAPRMGQALAEIAMSKTNPSSEMAQKVIRDLVTFQNSEAAYDKQKYGPDFQNAIRHGKDPVKYDSEYNANYPKDTFMLQGGRSNSPNVGQKEPPAKADAAKADTPVEGKIYKDGKGNRAKYVGGKWQEVK